LLSKPFLDFIHPEDHAKNDEEVEKLASGLQTADFENRYIHKDGSIRHLSWTATPLVDEHLMYCVGRDITEHKRIERTIRNLAEGVSGATGERFFRSLVRYLAESLGVEYALIGEWCAKNPGKVRTVSVCRRSGFMENFEYPLKGTPCENVIRREVCCYPENVRRHFPKDRLLSDLEIESYAGTPLFDSANRILGILVVFDGKPSPNPGFTTSILRIFAVRAAAELERKQAEEALRESEGKLAEKNFLLEQKNIALRELMEQVRAEKERIETQIRTNVDQLLLPIVTRLKGKGSPFDRTVLNLLEENLDKLLSPFGKEISRKMLRLSRREIEICNMIRSGLSSKEIARVLNLSHKSVETHRNNIRKKLGIRNEKINLATYLDGLQETPSE